MKCRSATSRVDIRCSIAEYRRRRRGNGLNSAGITLSDEDFAGLLTETIQHATRITARTENAEQLVEIDVPRLELPTMPDGVDLGSLYELAEALAQQGVR